MPLGSLPIHAAEISALIIGPLLLLLSVMLTTRGGSLYQRQIAQPSRVAAGLGSVGMAVFLAGGLVVGLSAASHPDRERRLPGISFPERESAAVAVADIPPAVPATETAVEVEPPAAATVQVAASEPVDVVLQPGGALLKHPVLDVGALAALPQMDLRPRTIKRRAR